MALTRPTRFEGQVRGVSHHGQETHLQKQAGYIDADFLHLPAVPLQSDGGPYIHGRRVLKDRYAAYLIMARRHISKNRPDTLTQTFFIHQLFPCSQTADHTLSKFDSQPVANTMSPIPSPWHKRRQCADRA